MVVKPIISPSVFSLESAPLSTVLVITFRLNKFPIPGERGIPRGIYLGANSSGEREIVFAHTFG